MEVKIYTANCCGNASNCLYPNRQIITDKKELINAIKCDQVFAEYKGNYRNVDNFISSNVIPLDCDNDHSENPNDWLTSNKLEKIFEDMQFVLFPSRNHMKAKNGKAPRSKFHILFPVSEYTDVSMYVAIKTAIQRK